MRLEQVAFASGAELGGFGDQRFEEAFDFVWLTVVGVESDHDIVFGSQSMSGFCQHDGSFNRTADVHAGGKFSATDGNLNDAVGLFVCETLESSIQSDQRRNVDSRVSVVAFLGGIDHFSVLFGCCDRHFTIPVCSICPLFTNSIAHRLMIIAREFKCEGSE